MRFLRLALEITFPGSRVTVEKKRKGRIFFMRTGVALLFLTVSIVLNPVSAQAIRFDKGTYQRLSYEKKTKEQFESFTVQNFKVLYDGPLTPAEKETVVLQIEESLRSVKDDFDFQPSGAYEVILLSPENYRKVDEPDRISSGFYQDKRIRILFRGVKGPPVDPNPFKSTFIHELSHLAVASLGSVDLPRWMNEGLAEYEDLGIRNRTPDVAKDVYQKQPALARLPPKDFFKLRTTLNKDGSYPPGLYEHGYAVVKYIVDQYGFGTVRDLLARMKTGESFSRAFSDVYKMSAEQMEATAYGF